MIFAGRTPNTFATCTRMYREQVITWSALRTIARSAAWMWDCGWFWTQPWWRPYSVAWTVDEPAADSISARRVLGGAGDEPVVRVDEVELDPVAQLGGARVHVAVHRVDPAHERARVLRERRLAHPVDDHAVLVGPRSAGGRRRA